VFSLATQTLSIGRMVYLLDLAGVDAEDVSVELVKIVARMLFATLMLMYLYKENVREFFGVDQLAIWKSLGLLALAVVATIVALGTLKALI